MLTCFALFFYCHSDNPADSHELCSVMRRGQFGIHKKYSRNCFLCQTSINIMWIAFFPFLFEIFFFVKSYRIGLEYSKSNSIKSFGLHLSVNQTVQWWLFMWMCYFTHKIYESNNSRMRVKKVPNSNTENRMIICIDSITYKLINPKQI